MAGKKRKVDILVMISFLLIIFIKSISDFSSQSTHSGFWVPEPNGNIRLNAGKSYQTTFSFKGMADNIHVYLKALDYEQEVEIQIKQKNAVIGKKRMKIVLSDGYADVSVSAFLNGGNEYKMCIYNLTALGGGGIELHG